MLIRLRYAVLSAVIVVFGAGVPAAIATGAVKVGYARVQGGEVPARSAPGSPPRQLIVPDLVAVVPTGITAAQVSAIGGLAGVRAVLTVAGGRVVINGRTVSVLGVPPVLRHLADTRVWLTFITVAELAKWAVMREWDESRRGRLEAWTAGRPVIPFDPRIAHLWGELTGQAKLRGRPRPQNHTWIAACCLRYGIPLVALNSADFGDFAEHHGLVLLGDREAARRR